MATTYFTLTVALALTLTLTQVTLCQSKDLLKLISNGMSENDAYKMRRPEKQKMDRPMNESLTVWRKYTSSVWNISAKYV
jgi:hypothetical protein